jgi:hypothetical protein
MIPQFKIVYNYHEEYEKVYPERFEQEYGYLRKRVVEVIYKFLDCGLLGVCYFLFFEFVWK